MAHIYKASLWQGGSGRWYVGDTEDLGNHSGAWWIPAHVLGITISDYVKKLIFEFKVAECRYDKEHNFLHFSWIKEADARKYKNYINAEARKKQFII